MKKSRLMPAWMLIAIDLFLIGALLCSFAYFHHIRKLWGLGKSADSTSPSIVFTKPPQMNLSDNPNTNTPYPDQSELEEGDYDYSGDFGATLPEVFLRVGEDIVYNDTTYQSKDIYMTLEEVNTELEYNNNFYNVQYFVYDIYVRNIENLYTVTADPRISIVDLIEKGEKANGGELIGVVNGDYWGNDNHTELVVRNGELLRYSDYISSDICVLYYDGTMETISPDEYDWDEIAAKSPYQIWEFGPELLDNNGKAYHAFPSQTHDSNVINNRHPRCAIGYYEPGHYCFVVVDGRSDDSQGVRMYQLADIFEKLGCTVAYNLDGGDSCQAYWGDEVIREDQERVEDGDDQRNLFDIIGIGEVVK